jgi:hypothetical protein
MAQKFGNGRWVEEGFLDNRIPGTVVGRVSFAGIGRVEVFLAGDFRGEIAGQAIRFRNSQYEDEEIAGHVLGDVESPQVGDVSLISFDPHPHLSPHPYIEWFSLRKNHYRIELAPGDAWIANEADLAGINDESRRIHDTLSGLHTPEEGRTESDLV